MTSTSNRTINPATGQVSVTFDTADLDKAFADGTHMELWYNWSFDAAWNSHTVSEQLEITAEIAKLAETATTLNLSASDPEPK